MKYYSMTEFASLAKCTRQNVHYNIKQGNIKAVLVGNGWIIPSTELDEFIKVRALTETYTEEGGDSEENRAI